MEDTIPVSSSLVKRNREIAEVREGLVKADQVLGVVRARNSKILEEISALDSDVSEHCARAAISEQHLAELFYVARDRSCEAAQQQVAHVAAVAALRAEAAQNSERLRPFEVQAEAEWRRAEGLEAEIERLNARLGAEEAALSLLKRTHADHLSVGSSAVLSATRDSDHQLQAISAQIATHVSEAVGAKRRCEELESELSSERQHREDIGLSLRKAIAEQTGDVAKLQALESAVVAQGGDPQATIGRAAVGGAIGNIPSEVEELRRQLQVSEDQRENLRLSLARSREHDRQMAARLQAQLDAARTELQRSLQQASEAHTSQVGQLEQEIQTERQRGVDEALAEQMCTERVLQLKEKRDRIRGERASTVGQIHAGDSRATVLEEELRRVRGEVKNAELRSATFQERGERADRRRREVQAEGEMRSTKIRGMIEELWKGLATARVSTNAASLGTARSVASSSSSSFRRDAASERLSLSFAPLARR